MNCEEFKQLIIPYLTDDDFDDELAKKVEEHMKACTGCWDYHVQQIKMIEVLQEGTIAGIIKEPVGFDDLIVFAHTAMKKPDNDMRVITIIEKALEQKTEGFIDAIKNVLGDRATDAFMLQVLRAAASLGGSYRQEGKEESWTILHAEVKILREQLGLKKDMDYMYAIRHGVHPKELKDKDEKKEKG